MITKNIALIFIIFLSFLSIGCSNADERRSETLNNNVKHELNSQDLDIVKQSNKILEKFLIEGSDESKIELKEFIPQALKIENSKERNAVLMNIYTQTKMYPEALALTNSMLIENPDNAGTQKFKCILLKSLHESEKNIKSCYLKEAFLIRTQLVEISPRDPLYPYIEWAYYVAMYHAGNKEYMNNLKVLIDSQNEDDRKKQFQAMYDAEISEQQLP